MTKDQIAQAVKDYVLAEFLPDEKPDALDASTPLISGGILDSIATLKLVSHLEDTYGIEFEAHEVGTDHLDTLNDIASIVASKVAAK